ncbi:Zn-ribbon domain-containing OB-fold protein [Haloarchaeobius sp. HME9146]|uniref:Zn-ribbon domain-containing OB-fold protein n=1 Tax=Haloarchaeobius sp. HME9146 TaxID=2978732 RepID=UPI0021C19E4B|nr:nucleic acid-binding protein [Haloarchaeobius sp. HME9146]MCT9098100.1 nucleic acid-binding protein [Haloarchaeobius sp. HME9146]
MNAETRDAGYDEFLDAIASDEGYYLACPEGHGSVPPTPRCPVCNATDLSEEPLPSSGVIEDQTHIHVAASGFEGETPYVVAIAAFGPVTMTGRLRGDAVADLDTGAAVVPSVELSDTTGSRMLVFRPSK